MLSIDPKSKDGGLAEYNNNKNNKNDGQGGAKKGRWGIQRTQQDRRMMDKMGQDEKKQGRFACSKKHAVKKKRRYVQIKFHIIHCVCAQHKKCCLKIWIQLGIKVYVVWSQACSQADNDTLPALLQRFLV
eukprot:scpid77808/ scgid7791/ 